MRSFSQWRLRRLRAQPADRYLAWQGPAVWALPVCKELRRVDLIEGRLRNNGLRVCQDRFRRQAPLPNRLLQLRVFLIKISSPRFPTTRPVVSRRGHRRQRHRRHHHRRRHHHHHLLRLRRLLVAAVVSQSLFCEMHSIRFI